MTEIRMKYKAYKDHYADCVTERGSYDPATKSIVVLVPDGRMKPSGVRGKTFGWYWFTGTETATGREVRVCIQAVCKDNAVRRLHSDYSGVEWNIA